MNTNQWRPTWNGGIAIVVILLVGTAIMYPMLTKSPHVCNATLTDDKYIPLANLSIETLENGVWKRKTTDARGQFDIYGPERVVKGFKLGWTTKHSGSGPFIRYHFNPSGRDRLMEGRRERLKPKD